MAYGRNGVDFLQPETVDYTGQMLVGTAASQVLTATAAKPFVFGMGGNDTINGSTGDDFLVGDYFDKAFLNALLNQQNPTPPPYQALVGNDVLNGGLGDDSFIDDLGNDVLNGGDGDDVIDIVVQNFGSDTFNGGAGFDQIEISDWWHLGFTFVSTARLVLNAAASIEYFWSEVGLHGTTGADVFDFSGTYNAGFNLPAGAVQLLLLGGNDRFTGTNGNGMSVNLGDGNDTGTGGMMNDTLIGDLGNDSLVGGLGNDSLRGDAGVDTLTGGDGSDQVLGGDGNDVLYGGAGPDALNGGAGADTMYGGTEDDTYYVDSALDLAVDTVGGGIDRVLMAQGGAYTLTAYVDNLTVTGSAAVHVTGNGLSNLIVGNLGNDTLTGLAGADSLYGGAGRDVLDGGTGADLLDGGAGDDVYYADVPADSIQEVASGGTDVVHAAGASYVLSANVETLIRDGSAAFKGTGNSGANTLTGNAGSDTLDGGLGADRLTGAAGSDTFLFSTALGNGNVDTIADFLHGTDHIGLSHAAGSPFHGLALGTLAASAFKITGTGLSLDADDRIIYNQPTGKIYLDMDGSGAGAALVFAQVTAGMVLTASDFTVI